MLHSFSFMKWPAGLVFLLMPAALLVFSPAAARAQSAEDILHTTRARYEQRMEGVQNYTVVHEDGPTLYYEKEQKNGHAVYRPVLTGIPENQRPQASASDPYVFFSEAASRGRRTGTEAVDGHATYVIEVDDLEGTQMDQMAEGEDHFEPRSAIFWIDQQRYVPRKMDLEGQVRTEGTTRSVTFEMHMSDYRDVKGMRYPFRMQVTSTGLLSSKQQKQMSAAMKKMREQMKNMPPAQRKRMKEMMKGKMGSQMGGMMDGDDKTSFTMNVKELRVNEGPPQDAQ